MKTFDFPSQEFIVCDEPVDHKGNETALAELEHGCVRWGGQGRHSIAQ